MIDTEIGNWITTATISSDSISFAPSYYNEYRAEQSKREAAERKAKELAGKLDKMKSAEKKPLAVKRIFKTGERMTVLWEDGTKTIVKRAEDEPASDYAAFTAALGIKVFGTNSELKRLVATAKEQGRKKKTQKDSMSEFDEAGRAACESLNRLGKALQKVKDAMTDGE